jgi:hypothetical protein
MATPATTPNTTHNDPIYYTPQLLSNDRDPQEDVFLVATLSATKALFPGEFMDAIVRTPSSKQSKTRGADISMILHDRKTRALFGCQMEIAIEKEKVAFYAKKLFNTEVGAKDGVRHISGSRGVKIEPNPSLQLRGCPRDIISVVFGIEVAKAISQGPIYRREEEEERDETNAVSMAITNKDSETGRIILYLGDFLAYKLRDKLYK